MTDDKAMPLDSPAAWQQERAPELATEGAMKDDATVRAEWAEQSSHTRGQQLKRVAEAWRVVRPYLAHDIDISEGELKRLADTEIGRAVAVLDSLGIVERT